MKTVRNTTRRPLAVPLPGGRKLHLGPGQSGDISPRAAEHPPLAALVASGALAITDTDPLATGAERAGGALHGPAAGHRPGTKSARRGDR